MKNFVLRKNGLVGIREQEFLPHLLVLGLRAARALGEEAVLVAAGVGDGRPAAGAGVLIEQRHRAEFRYRIIVRRVNCTVRVHRCG